MTIRRLLLLLCLAGALRAQTFIQMSDPQFGMFTKNAGFVHETANFEFAIASANRLKPAFVVITGDLVNEASNPAQVAEYKRITAKLDPQIRLFSVPGNHDVGRRLPTPTKDRGQLRGGGRSRCRFRRSRSPEGWRVTVRLER